MAFAGINYLAVLVAAVAAWLVGAVWYKVLSEQWLAALEKTRSELMGPDGKPKSFVPLVLVLVAEIIMAWVLAGILGHLGDVTVKNGVVSRAFCWLGFVVTTVATNNAFPRRKIMLTVIDSGHWLAVLVVMGAIIGAFGVK